ncbi:hypothetical protein LCGC14_2327040 [marine sediment metagenome]|uniref:Protein kinase domain-containing protein n=2 Tax=root TaxID=1 RepID=A0A831VX08_9GAMM|nr:protein kinase [Marinobacter antarcticus]HEA53654.1 hypothetical protein [Marinobacter antarcticus]
MTEFPDEHCKFLGVAGSPAEALRQEAEIQLLQALGDTPEFPSYRADGYTRSGVRYVAYREVAGRALSKYASSVELLSWRSFTVQLLGLVKRLHGSSFPVFHGDISPANIIVSHSGKVGLIDFGVARSRLLPFTLRFSSRQSTAAPLYLSPEQAQGNWWGSASDLYQVGLVVMEFLRRKPLGQGLGVPKLLARLRESPDYARTVAVSELGLPGQFLAGLLDPDPTRRPSALQALAQLD